VDVGSPCTRQHLTELHHEGRILIHSREGGQMTEQQVGRVRLPA